MSAVCPHIKDLAHRQPPRLSQSVHREECTQCFDNQDLPVGVDVCLTCFNGACLDEDRHHARTHFVKYGHGFTLNVKRKVKPSAKRAEDEEPPAKMTKLAIVEDRDEDKYEHVTVVKCWHCDIAKGLELPDASSDPSVKSLVDGVMQSMSSARQSEVKAWEEEILPCEHTLTLEQLSTGQIPASGLAHCQKCDLKENLWLCLTCGSLGCGRQQFGGVGGNGHGLQHYQESHHPISVKLGTITPEGGADIYCYVCNDSKQDPDLATHLAAFGINVQTQTKTEKSMTELQIEHNLKFDFSLTDEDGKALEPVFGPGLTGISNLGNSCYMASVIQALFSLPSFQKRYGPTAAEHWATCPEPLPASCVDCQMHKLADGLLSGRYSHPASYIGSAPPNGNVPAQNSPVPVFQEGLKPSGFKALVGKGHEEFSTMRQQDSEEFLTYLLTVLRRHTRKVSQALADQPTEAFAFGVEQRLQCGDCKKVRYRVDPTDIASVPVPAKEKGKEEDGNVIWEDVKLTECLDIMTGTEALEYDCPSCRKKVIATKLTRFATFPDVLVIHIKKFQLVNWVPSKLDIPVILPQSDHLQLDEYIGRGLQPGETELPNSSTAAPEAIQFNEAAMEVLLGMGFPRERCQQALLATGNNNAEEAMEWLFSHMDDQDTAEPGPQQISSGQEPSADQISALADMGFTANQARKALRETGGSTERAVEWLFNHPDDMGEDEASATTSNAQPSFGGSSTLPAKYKLKAFISHKGPSVHSGHYVAHIKVGNDWVLFNDEKVVKADHESVMELKKLAYLYVFEKV